MSLTQKQQLTILFNEVNLYKYNGHQNQYDTDSLTYEMGVWKIRNLSEWNTMECDWEHFNFETWKRLLKSDIQEGKRG